jgi:hypothetical protein
MLAFPLCALQVVRLVDALESRVVSSSSSSALHAKLRSLSDKLELLEAQLAPTNVKGLRHAVDAITAAVDLQARHLLLLVQLLGSRGGCGRMRTVCLP